MISPPWLYWTINIWISCPWPIHVKVLCSPKLKYFGFKSSFGTLVSRDSNRNQNIGQKLENKKCPASLTWYLELRSRTCPASSGIVTSTDLADRNRERPSSVLLILVVWIKLWDRSVSAAVSTSWFTYSLCAASPSLFLWRCHGLDKGSNIEVQKRRYQDG